MVARKKSGLGANPFKSQSFGIFSPTEPATTFDEGDDNQSNDDSPLTVEVARIVLPKQQPRRFFDPNRMQQLVESIREHGILEPLLVRPIDDSYELVAGERRYRAAKEVGLTEVPIVIRHMSDREALQIAIVENLQREDLNPLEETEGLLALLSMQLQLPGQDVSQLLHRLAKSSDNVVGEDADRLEIIESIFKIVGRIDWKSFASHRLPLLNLPGAILDALREGKLEYTKARAIAKVKDSDQRDLLLEEAVEESLSLSQIKERIKAVSPSSSNSSEPTVSDRLVSLSRRLKKGLADPRKQKKLEKLLQDLESLIED